MSTVFLYSGQGSQYYHMGRELYAVEPVFRACLDHLDRRVGQNSDLSVIARMYDPGKKKSDPFSDTVLSSLAIFMLECALTETLRHYGHSPDMVLGVSLGAFTASAVARAVEREAMLDAILELFTLLEKTCAPGVMLALVGPGAKAGLPELRELAETAFEGDDGLRLVSMPAENADRVETVLVRSGIAFQKLPVALAYHSRWLEPAKMPVLHALERLAFSHPDKPVEICLAEQSSIDAPGLWNCMRSPMRWGETVRRLEMTGPHLYVDLGPSGTLATLLRHSLGPDNQSVIVSLLTPYASSAPDLRRLPVNPGNAVPRA